MSKLTKALTAAAGNAGGDNLYVEDVFSTHLYTGTGATLPIVNGIDLDGEGGMVWTKDRLNDSSDFYSHYLSDSERNNFADTIYTNLLGGGDTRTNYITPSSTGYSLGTFNAANTSGRSYTSFAFRKAEKFFDVVTWTGNGTAGRTIPHNLNGTVGSIWIKATNDSAPWTIWHRGLSSTTTNYFYDFGTATTEQTDSSVWNSTAPTSTEITLGTSYRVNANSTNYVAYIFAHNNNDGTFGEDGEQDIIKCGVYQGLDSGSRIELGFEPQFLMIKRRDGGGTYAFGMWDIMRGFVNSGNDALLQPGRRDAELSSFSIGHPDSTGFVIDASSSDWITSSGEYCYIAIRRPMKTPESGTEVFGLATKTGDGSARESTSLKGTDLYLSAFLDANDYGATFDRIRGKNGLRTSTAASEINAGVYFDGEGGNVRWSGADWNNTGRPMIDYFFRRAPGFFDVVAYTGNATFGRTVTHGLGAVPEMIIVKARNKAEGWPVYHAGIASDAETDVIFLQGDAPFGDNGNLWADTKPTATNFTLGLDGSVNDNSAYNYIAYLFATLAGVSKVGSYTGTGTGSSINVDCGFSAGARFVLIKRTDSTGDWFVWDSVRGIVAGNDPYISLNTSGGEVTSTDYIDPLASGFTVTSTATSALNHSGGTYIFLAIA